MASLALKIPDLVAFNQRVHEWLDPWFERKWVRRLSWGAAGAILFGGLVFVYFATGLPSSEKLLAYQPPLPSNVRVTNLGNHRSVVVRVNDRGPFVGGRVIDVSAKTAKELGFYDDGLSKVKVEYVGRAQ